MRIKPFQTIYPDFRYITSVDGFFSRVKEDYPEYKKSGFFQKANRVGLYVYQIKRKDRKHVGLLSLVHINDYLEGRIKIHEKTIAAKEQQQTHLLLARNAQVKPVLLTCKEVPDLNRALADLQIPENVFYRTTFEDSNEEHTFWEVSNDREIQHLTDILSQQVTETFIADGHHRTSTMAHLYERHLDSDHNPYAHLLVALFPENQLEVHDYNRVVERLVDSTLSNFIARLSRVCNITPIEEGKKPVKKHQMTMYINREWYRLEWRSKLLDKHADQDVLLDTQLLDKYVLEDILNIQDIRTDDRLRYVDGPSGIRGLRTKTLKNENRIGFCLFPVALDDLMTISKNGGVMPPKSTWFEPRIKNGLMVLDLNIKRNINE